MPKTILFVLIAFIIGCVKQTPINYINLTVPYPDRMEDVIKLNKPVIIYTLNLEGTSDDFDINWQLWHQPRATIFIFPPETFYISHSIILPSKRSLMLYGAELSIKMKDDPAIVIPDLKVNNPRLKSRVSLLMEIYEFNS